MKKIMLAAFVVLTVGSALAFKSHNTRNGPFFCQEEQGTCQDLETKYKLDDTQGKLWCSNGMPNDLNCTNHVKVAVNP